MIYSLSLIELPFYPSILPLLFYVGYSCPSASDHPLASFTRCSHGCKANPWNPIYIYIYLKRIKECFFLMKIIYFHIFIWGDLIKSPFKT